MPAACACSTSLIWLEAPLPRSAKIRRAARPGPTALTRWSQTLAGELMPMSTVPAARTESMEVPADADSPRSGAAKLGANRPGQATAEAPAAPAPTKRRSTLRRDVEFIGSAREVEFMGSDATQIAFSCPKTVKLCNFCHVCNFCDAPRCTGPGPQPRRHPRHQVARVQGARPTPTEGSRTQGEGLRTSRPQPLPRPLLASYATVTSRVATVVLPQLSVTVTVMV